MPSQAPNLYGFVRGVESSVWALFAKEVLVHLPAVLERVERRVLDHLHPFLCWASCGMVSDVLEEAVGCAGAASRGAWGGRSGQEACLNAQVAFCCHFCNLFIFLPPSGSSSPFLFFSRLNLAVKSEFLNCDFSPRLLGMDGIKHLLCYRVGWEQESPRWGKLGRKRK